MTRFLGILLLLFACSGNSEQESGVAKSVSPKQFRELIARKTGFQLVDVRTQQECRSAYLKNALLIDYYQPDFRQKLEKLDKNKPIGV